MKYALYQRLSELRKAKGISQATLGEAVGLDQRFIANIENGNKFVSVDTLVLLAKYFNVSTDYLLGLDLME